MREKQKGNWLANLLSVLYMVAAVCLLFAVCGCCYPRMGDQVRQMIGGWKNGPVQESFRVLTESLEAGLPMKETVKASVEVLFGELV